MVFESIIRELLSAKRRAWMLPLGTGIAASVLYIQTLAPGTVYFQDAGEFSAKLHTLELIHPTGYPYYQLLGKLWTLLLPVGSVAWRINLFSAFFSVMTVVLLTIILQRVMVPSWAIVSASGILACSPVFWEHSIMASVYTMHVALVALTMLTLLRWQAGESSPLWFALACGLGLAHHRTFLFSLPAMGIALIFDPRIRSERWTQWLKLGAVTLVTVLLSYLWLIRLGVWPLSRLLDYLLNQGREFVHYAPTLSAWAQHLWKAVSLRLIPPFGVIPTILGFLGFLPIAGPQSHNGRRQLSFLSAALGLVTLITFSWIWVAPDEYRYFLQLDFVLAIGWGLLLDRVRRWLLCHRQEHPWLTLVAQFTVIVGAVGLLPISYRSHVGGLAKLRDGYADRVSKEILATMESDTTVFGDWILGWPIRYYHAVEGMRTDVNVIIGGNESMAVELLEAGTPVYFRQPMFELDLETSPYHWAKLDIGTLYRASLETPAITHTEEVDRAFAEGSALVGVGFSPWPLRPDAFTRMKLQWESSPASQGARSIELRLTDHSGTTFWHHRTRIESASDTDIYLVTPPTLLPGEYLLSLAVKNVEDGGQANEVRLNSIPVNGRGPLDPSRLILDHYVVPPHPVPAVDPDVRLLGHNLGSREVWIGRETNLSLFWQVVGTPSSPYQPGLLLQRGDQSYDIEATCPVSAPYPGALTESRCRLTVPFGVDAGPYSLVLSMADQDIPLQRVRARDRSRLFRLPSIQHDMTVRVGEDMQLLGYDLNRASLHAGSEIVVTLYWRAEKHPLRDYKVFTHLMGPEGNLVSQHDSPPAGGQIPTSQLLELEVVIDRHPISVPAHATAGDYQINVGMYVPETGERLPAVKEDGTRYTDDAIPLQILYLRVP